MSFLLRRLRSKSRGLVSRRPSKTFARQFGGSLLRLENLEQRALLDAGGFLTAPAGPATHFALWAPANETVGSQTPLEVVALDASNHLVRNFTGTVSFSSTDASSTLPADYTFAASDHGHHLFQFTPGATGSETITASDSADSISGDITVNVNPAPVATHFLVYAPEDTTAGSATNVLVVALDASNHRVDGYTGTVTLTSSDGQATLPASYTFTSSDHGIHVFQVTFANTGTQSVTATDDSTPPLNGQVSLNVNPAPVATHFLVYAPEDTTVGKATNVVVIALDASNHRVDGYTGTVTLASSDTGATLPASYTFTATDHGIHVFQVTFANTGTQSVTAADNSTPQLSGQVSLNVNPAPVATHFLVYAPENTTVGKATNVVVIALDASNHRVDGYTGTVTLTSSDGGATLPASYTFTAADHGIHVFQVTFANTGTQSVTATDDSTPPLTGQVSLNVNPAPVATHFAVFVKGSVVSGQPFTLEVVALDVSNHRVPNYTGTVQLSSSVTGETLPAAYTFTAADEGEHEFQLTLNTAGSDAITASDGTLTGSVTLNVLAAPAGGSGGSGGANFAQPNLSHFDAVFAAFSQARRWRG